MAAEEDEGACGVRAAGRCALTDPKIDERTN